MTLNQILYFQTVARHQHFFYVGFQYIARCCWQHGLYKVDRCLQSRWFIRTDGTHIGAVPPVELQGRRGTVDCSVATDRYIRDQLPVLKFAVMASIFCSIRCARLRSTAM